MKIWKNAVIFYLSGCLYVGLELLWRGRSHGSMFLAGGLSAVLVGQLNEVRPRLPFFFRALTGAGIITMVELGTGLLVNRDYRVWDYRARRLHLWGQVCPEFSFLWVLLAAAVLWGYPSLSRALPGEDPR